MMTAFHRQHLEMKQPHACIVMNIFAESWRRFMRTCQSRRRMLFSRWYWWRCRQLILQMACYYYADRSRLCIRQGKNSDAKRYTDKSHAFDLARRKLLYYYNHVMSNGKWNGILTPEDFPPPRTAMYPSCRVPLHAAADKLIVTCWNTKVSLPSQTAHTVTRNGLNLQMQETAHCHIRLKSQSGLRLSVHFQQKEHLQKKLASFLA